MNEEEIQKHLEEHADMFAPEDRTLDPLDGEAAVETAQEFLEFDSLPDDATQTVTVAELRELLDYAFSQGRMRGYAECLQGIVTKVNEDPEITDDIKEYFNTLLGGM